MNYKAILLISFTFFITKTNDSYLVLGESEDIKEILSHHLGNFSMGKSGSTNAVTDVFYNIPISNTKLSSSSAGVELKQSGRYYLANNLRKAIGADIAYVKFSGNSIVLDMNGCTIQGDAQASSTTAKGIYINQNIVNSKVVNGNITGMQGLGIETGTGCDTVTLEDIIISKFKSYGIFVGGSSKNINFKNINGSVSSGSTTYVYGIYLNQVDNGEVKNCQFNKITTTGDTAYGFNIVGCNSITFRNCDSNSNSSSGTDAYGFSVNTTASSALKFVNCNANNNIGTNGYGFSASSDLTECLFENCTASSNSGTSASGFGFSFLSGATCTGNLFINCEAGANTSGATTTTVSAAGFFMSSSCDSNIFNNCNAYANGVTASSGAATGCGFYATGSSNCSWKNCISNGNYSDSTSGKAHGIFLDGGGRSNKIDACEIVGTSLTAANASGTSSGIYLGNSESLTSISNCSIIGTKYSGSGSSGSSFIYGIHLGTDTTGVDKCTVTNNTVRSTGITTNTSTTHTLAGLRDFTTDSNSLISGNILALNGTNRLDIGSAPDYNIEASDLSASNSSGGLNLYLTYSSEQNPADIVVETDISNMQALSTGLEGWSNYLIVPDQA